MYGIYIYKSGYDIVVSVWASNQSLILGQSVPRQDTISVTNMPFMMIYIQHCVSLSLVSHHRFKWEGNQLPVKIVCMFQDSLHSIKIWLGIN